MTEDLFLHLKSRPLAHTLYPVEDTEMCLITKSDKSDVKSVLGEQRVHGVNKVWCF